MHACMLSNGMHSCVVVRPSSSTLGLVFGVRWESEKTASMPSTCGFCIFGTIGRLCGYLDIICVVFWVIRWLCAGAEREMGSWDFDVEALRTA